MGNVDLTQAKKLIGATDVQSTNELLSKGWKLIETAPGKDEMGYPMIRYSLAWFGNDKPPA